jgi:hypothetical protein
MVDEDEGDLSEVFCRREELWFLDVTEDNVVAVEGRESLEFRWSEDKVIGWKSLGEGECGGVSVSVFEGQGSSATNPAWASGLIVGDDARWGR